MCCFSQTVESVSDTAIFARPTMGNRQVIVYSMKLKAGLDLSMILPLPVAKDVREEDVTFINMEKAPSFFEDLRAGFPKPVVKSDADRTLSLESSKAPPKLKVVEVGSFVASFVPSIKDFARLDGQFRLPTTVWDKLPQYRNAGFAVFKLKKGESKIHPMAFEFPRANARQIFFPTVHIHDGSVPDRATFDHELFCQGSGETDLTGWEESPQPAGLFMPAAAEKLNVMDMKGHCYRRTMKGRYPNTDVTV